MYNVIIRFRDGSEQYINGVDYFAYKDQAKMQHKIQDLAAGFCTPKDVFKLFSNDSSVIVLINGSDVNTIVFIEASK